ncbi:MAG TPA: hypothetical protein P5555_08220 [Candidatus Paceibacterota bacterium]|nr:hypothetical protein [Verrucomicrobiota bacterium]HRZ45157.1 hypothetical protein [Candidatus Paceibacterota bacterium]
MLFRSNGFASRLYCSQTSRNRNPLAEISEKTETNSLRSPASRASQMSPALRCWIRTDSASASAPALVWKNRRFLAPSFGFQLTIQWGCPRRRIFVMETFMTLVLPLVATIFKRNPTFTRHLPDMNSAGLKASNHRKKGEIWGILKDFQGEKDGARCRT